MVVGAHGVRITLVYAQTGRKHASPQPVRKNNATAYMLVIDRFIYTIDTCCAQLRTNFAESLT